MAKDDGGPAFPLPDTEKYYGSRGMTLRDYFAAAAMQALFAVELKNVTVHGETVTAMTPSLRAELAYAEADAMLAERAK